jgi:hypothetical protein
MNFDQGQFNFDAKGSEDGFRKWREELDARKKAFETRWGVILDRRVRITLKDYVKPLTGRLEWISNPKAKPDEPPRFRLRGVEFVAADLESIVQEDAD